MIVRAGVDGLGARHMLGKMLPLSMVPCTVHNVGANVWRR